MEDLRAFLGIQSLTGLRLFNRYDLEGINRELFDYAVQTVLSEPQLDTVTSEVPQGDTVFAVEYLPGQYDQRADSAAQCIQILSQGERPTVRTARVYVLEGELTAEQVEAVKKYVINPVESREASLELPETLRMEYDIPTTVRTVEGFTSMDAAALDALRDELGLAMDLDDLKFLQGYFRDDEGRNPTITEIRVVDTYWSDHCRHTTFSTHIDQVEIHDAAIQAAYERYLAARVEVYGEEKASKRPQTLMDIGTAGQGVPDAAADAGGRAAEGLDLRGVVVGLIFEHQQPVLGLAVHRGGDMDGAGIDLLTLVQLRQQAPLFQDLRADGGNVHQGLGPGGSLLSAVDLHPCGQVPLVGGLNGRVMDLHLVDVGGEGGVAAVVGPVGVYHPDLGDGGVPTLVIPEIAL